MTQRDTALGLGEILGLPTNRVLVSNVPEVPESKSLVTNTPEDTRPCDSVATTETPIQAVAPLDKSRDADLSKARENLLDLMKVGRDALDSMVDIARADESSRSFEVVATLIKNMAELSDKMASLHNSTTRPGSPGTPKTPVIGKQTNNIIMSGSSRELQQMLQRMKSESEAPLTTVVDDGPTQDSTQQ